jgi:aldose 1-epimerase
MDVLTTQPGLHVETANRLDGSIVGKGGAAHGRYSGVSLATQPALPPAILLPADSFEARTVYKFR